MYTILKILFFVSPLLKQINITNAKDGVILFQNRKDVRTYDNKNYLPVCINTGDHIISNAIYVFFDIVIHRSPMKPSRSYVGT